MYKRQPQDGVSLLPLLGGETLKREALFFHYPNYAFHKRNRLGGAIRKGSHKLIQFYDDDSVELYDVVTDPGEKKNLAESQPELTAALRSQLRQWLKASGAKMPFAPSN